MHITSRRWMALHQESEMNVELSRKEIEYLNVVLAYDDCGEYDSCSSIEPICPSEFKNKMGCNGCPILMMYEEKNTLRGKLIIAARTD